ncbi:uncharacterized protein RBU57_010591 [Macrochelys suwanniensis]
MQKSMKKIAKAMTERGYSRDATQCHVKIKELRQAYQKTKESNGRSGSDPQTCRFYAALHAVLGGAATTTPPMSVDSEDGVFSSLASSEVFADGEDDEGDDEDEVVDSALQGDFPESQELFITLTEIPSQRGILDREAGEGTSAATVPRLPLASPSQRLSQIRRRKKRTRDEMFSELMQCSCTEVAQQNVWRDRISQYKEAASKWEDRRDARAERWQQEDQRVSEAMVGLLREQTDTLRCLVDVLQERRQDDRPPLQPICNRSQPSPSPIASSPRVSKTQGGRQRADNHSTPADCSSSRRLSFHKF